MKLISILFLLGCTYFPVLSQPDTAPFRIFGQVSTVDNQTLTGYMIWNKNKNCWIDLFEAEKSHNPYNHYFDKDDWTLLQNSNNTFAHPPTHTFCCRFGHIRSIRLSGANEINLEMKNGQNYTLKKGGFQDIGAEILLFNGVETYRIHWEYISEIVFMPANASIKVPELPLQAGIVKSSQGIYKGLIHWNSSSVSTPEKMNARNKLFAGNPTIIRDRSAFTIIYSDGSSQVSENTRNNPLFWNSDLQINMPNVGTAYIPWEKFEQLEIVPLSQLQLPTYDDFILYPLKGTVISHQGEKISGTLAYDLDEAWNFEMLDGKNDNIKYRIPFQYIISILPKNYKYSYVTLQGGNGLSLGDSPDVNQENSGIIIFPPQQIPVYIPWKEIKEVKIDQEE